MKEWAEKQWQKAMVWKLAIARCILFSLVTLGTAWQTSTSSVDFGAMDRWERLSLFIGIFVLWGNQMLSFLDKTTANIAAGKSPSAGNTEFLKSP